jgi:Thoeris protein ThsB, TIR-like domain
MATLKTYDLFISHSWAYGDGYDKLCEFFDDASYFSYRNYSVPKNDPIHSTGTNAQLYEAIKRKISPVNIVIIMAGVYSTYSKWINKEIKIAQTEFYSPKPILAVAPWGAEKISTVVSSAADEIARWNAASIVGAIRRLAI